MISSVLTRKREISSIFLDDTIVDLLSKTFQIPSDYNCQIIEVAPEYVARPDLLCDDLYGDEDYADILMKLNGISNPYELNTDMLLVVPTVECLDDFIITPSSAWSQSESEIEASFDEYKSNASSTSSSSTALQKTSKRKPNEAVLGDSRFVIDPLSKVIVY